MSTRKTSNKKRKKQNRAKRVAVKNTQISQKRKEVFGVLTSGFGLFYLLSIYSKATGKIGQVLFTISKGLFGVASYVVPLLVILLGVWVIVSSNNTKLNTYKSISGLIIFFSLTNLVHLFYLQYFDTSNVSQFISSSWQAGLQGRGTGALFALFAFGGFSLLGTLGSYLLHLILLTVSILVLSNLSLKEMGQTIYNRYKVENVEKETSTQNKKETKLKGATIKLKRKNSKNKIEDTNKKQTGEEAESKPQDEIKIVHFDQHPDTQKIQTSAIEQDQGIEAAKSIEQEMSESDKTTTKPYIFPPLNLLNHKAANHIDEVQQYAIKEKAIQLEDALSSFGLNAKVHQISRGPAITRFELQPTKGVKLSKFTNLAEDIALNLAVPSVRIAPISGKTTIGIEVPNEKVRTVLAGEIIAHEAFKSFESDLAFPLGMDLSGRVIVSDIEKMPHVLIAGATGSGKSVCINSLVIGLLYKASPEDVKLIMIDPKVVELNQYNGIPHLMIPVVTDPKKAAGALNWAVKEMTNRYELFAKEKVKDVTRYNEVAKKRNIDKLPKIVVIIDELADLMMIAAKEVEDSICRLAQMARAAGIYLVIATQRPSVDIITGVIKANIPSRIAFSVSSAVDSRTILDSSGAEKLLGKGDMLYYPSGEAKPLRVQGTFIKETEIEAVVNFIKGCFDKNESMYNESLIHSLDAPQANVQADSDEQDELLLDALKTSIDTGHASISLLQRRHRIGYARAARLIDELESRGYISGFEGSKPRKVLVTTEDYNELLKKES